MSLESLSVQSEESQIISPNTLTYNNDTVASPHESLENNDSIEELQMDVLGDDTSTNTTVRKPTGFGNLNVQTTDPNMELVITEKSSVEPSSSPAHFKRRAFPLRRTSLRKQTKRNSGRNSGRKSSTKRKYHYVKQGKKCKTVMKQYKKQKCRGKHSRKCKTLQKKRRTCKKIIKHKQAMARQSRKMQKK